MSNSIYYNRLISQLDDLVVFVSLTEEDFFIQLENKWSSILQLSEINEKPISKQHYEQIILRSTLLLGITYLEACFTDILKDIYKSKPEILATRKKEISWDKIVKSKSYEEIINYIIDKELTEFTHLSTEKMVDYLRNGLNIEIQVDTYLLRESSLVRNLITHNGAIVNNELHELNNNFCEGDEIFLTVGKIHEYGLSLRDIIRILDESLVQKYSITK